MKKTIHRIIILFTYLFCFPPSCSVRLIEQHIPVKASIINKPFHLRAYMLWCNPERHTHLSVGPLRHTPFHSFEEPNCSINVFKGENNSLLYKNFSLAGFCPEIEIAKLCVFLMPWERTGTYEQYPRNPISDYKNFITNGIAITFYQMKLDWYKMSSWDDSENAQLC